MDVFMDKIETNRKKRRFSRAGFFLILSILLALALAVVLLLPSMVELAVNRILKHSAAGGYIVCNISQITPFSANAAVNARQKMPNGRFRSVLSLPHCRISYTPFALLRGRIEGITITGATIPASVENGNVVFPLTEIFESVQQEKEEQQKKNAASPAANVPDLGFIRIENGALNLRYGRKSLYVPVTMTIRQEGSGWKKLLVKGRIHLNGQTIVIREASVDLEQKSVRAAVRIRDAVLSNLPHPLDLYANEVGLQGDLTAELLADFNYGTGVVKKIDSRWKIRNFSALVGGRHISSDLFLFNLEFNGKKGAVILENLKVADLFQLSRTATEFELSDHSLSGKTTLEVTGAERRQFDFLFSAAGDPAAKTAEVSIRTAEGKACELSWKGIQGRLDALALQLKGSPERQTARLTLNGIGIDCSGKKALIRELALSALHENGVLSGTLAGNIASVEDPASSVTAKDIVFSVPFRRGGREEGSITVDSISWKDRLMAKVQAKTGIELSNTLLTDRAEISGMVTMPEYPGIGIRFRSENEYDNGRYLSRNTFVLPETEIPALDFRKMGGELANLKVTGKVGASGGYEFASGRAGEGAVRLSISGASVKDPAQELSLEGVNLEFELPSLPALRSSPGLKASVNRIRFGGIDVRDFLLFYRMESPTVWAVEAVKAGWASGVVRMEFTRFDFSKKSCELVLHCDRLNLSEILNQLGQKAAVGEGTLNGTLPVTISPGNIVFHDGFLNSTPGVTGSLKLSNTEYLTAGVPQNIPQYAQLKFSQDVLKDFSYDWAKLNLTSKSDILTLQMKISGRPSHPLPYRYDGGELVQINTLTEFAGVRLDINFNLPLANVLNIINNIKKLSGGGL